MQKAAVSDLESVQSPSFACGMMDWNENGNEVYFASLPFHSIWSATGLSVSIFEGKKCEIPIRLLSSTQSSSPSLLLCHIGRFFARDKLRFAPIQSFSQQANRFEIIWPPEDTNTALSLLFSSHSGWPLTKSLPSCIKITPATIQAYL